MTREDMLFYIAVIGAPAAVISCIYQVISYHRPQQNSLLTASPPNKFSGRPILINSILALIVCAAVGFDYYDRHSLPLELPMPSWGVIGQPSGFPLYSATVDTHAVFDGRNKYKLMLLARNNWASVDRLTDTAIEKSGLYSIDGTVIPLQIIGKGVIKWAIGAPNMAELYIVMLPNDVSPDQITRLADIDKIGGKIVAKAGQAVVGQPSINPTTTSSPP